MPHIDIKCYPGRTDAQKKQLADRIAQDVAEIFETEEGVVSVAIQDIPAQEWKERVWDQEIVPRQEFLYRKPEYNYDD